MFYANFALFNCFIHTFFYENNGYNIVHSHIHMDELKSYNGSVETDLKQLPLVYNNIS